jgi:hypothetical protein
MMKKYSIEELKELVKVFMETHPNKKKEDWFAPVYIMEGEAVESFLTWLSTLEKVL